MVAKFDRCLREAVLKVLGARPRWCQDLLDYRFKDVSGREQPLFLAVRNGYLNAYVEGQSVFGIRFNTQAKPLVLRAKIHHKFVDPTAAGQDHFIFDGEWIIDRNGKKIEKYEGPKSLDQWVRRAQTYVRVKDGAVTASEKQGVAAIIGRNVHVIDVGVGSRYVQKLVTRLTVAKARVSSSRFAALPPGPRGQALPQTLMMVCGVRKWVCRRREQSHDFSTAYRCRRSVQKGKPLRTGARSRLTPFVTTFYTYLELTPSWR